MGGNGYTDVKGFMSTLWRSGDMAVLRERGEVAIIGKGGNG